jgi:2-dehydro-3-deoxy-D-arabinonate dehydratase
MNMHPNHSKSVAMDSGSILKLYRTARGPTVEVDGRLFVLSGADWDALLWRPDLSHWLIDVTEHLTPLDQPLGDAELLPPIGSQEVWAAGVTYYRSRTARMEESSDEGDFYDRVYGAARPELFFKASPHRVVGHLGKVRVRSDAKWSVPEPELTVCVAPDRRIIGYTIGNDMSSRDIEGENPLYLPQAKVYDQCCALGPGILVAQKPLPASTEIRMEIRRNAETVFAGSTRLERMKRTPEELVDYLYRENSFPAGCFLLTGTGIVPPSDFTLVSGDEIKIAIDPIGTLINSVI